MPPADRLRRAGILAPALLVALIGCMAEPPAIRPIETTRSYPQGTAVTWNRLVHYLRARGLTITSGEQARGLLRAENRHLAQNDWAVCEAAWVVDRSSNSLRPVRARPVHREVAVLITVTGDAAASRVQVRSDFTEKQINPYRNLPFDQPCRATGVLEAGILAAPADQSLPGWQ